MTTPDLYTNSYISKRSASAAQISCAKEQLSLCLLHADRMMLNNALLQIPHMGGETGRGDREGRQGGETGRQGGIIAPAIQARLARICPDPLPRGICNRALFSIIQSA